MNVSNSNHDTGTADAVILTAIPLELKAVLSLLDEVGTDRQIEGTWFKLGRLLPETGRPWNIAVARVGTGNGAAAALTQRAIAAFKPGYVLFVGVGGGIKDVKLGDVVAATKVHIYHAGKAAGDFLPRPESYLPTHAMEQIAGMVMLDHGWLSRNADWQQSQHQMPPNVLLKPIASGEQVVADTRSVTHEFIRQQYGDAVAVDMEGGGFSQATHFNEGVQGIVIRGISDLIDHKAQSDDAGWQPVAATNAAAFALAMLEYVGRQSGSSDQPLPPRPHEPELIAVDHQEEAAKLKQEAIAGVREVLDELARNDMHELRAGLERGIQRYQPAGVEDLAVALCDLDPEKAIGVVLHRATEDCLLAHADPALWQQARNLFGSLLLLAMQPGELGRMREQLRQSGNCESLQVPISDDRLLDILTTLLRGRRPDISKPESGVWIKAKSAPEAGPFASDVIAGFQQELWQHLGLDDAFGKAEEPLNDDQKQSLNGVLGLEWERGNHRFLAIPAQDASNALNTAEIQQQLSKELPGVWPLYFGSGDLGVLLVFKQEGQLCYIIDSFRGLEQKYL